jgi:hypothetical protein
VLMVMLMIITRMMKMNMKMMMKMFQVRYNYYIHSLQSFVFEDEHTPKVAWFGLNILSLSISYRTFCSNKIFGQFDLNTFIPKVWIEHFHSKSLI